MQRVIFNLLLVYFFMISQFSFLPYAIAQAQVEVKINEKSDLSSLQEHRSFDAKIAVVDVTSILEHSQAVIGIKSSIEDISQKIQNELLEKEIELKEAEALIIEKRSSLPDKEFEKLVSDFNAKVSATQHEMQVKKNALEKAHAAAMAEVHENTVSVISNLAKKHSFNIVLPSSHVIYVSNSLNITHEVISNLNDKLKEVRINYEF